MVTKQLDLTDLYQRLKIVVDTWIDLIPFKIFDYKAETSDYSCEISSNAFNLITYRDRGLPSSTLSITSLTKKDNGTLSDLVFSVVFRSYCRGKVEFELKDEWIGEYNSDWYDFTHKFFYPISNSQRNKLYESLTDLQLSLYSELKSLEKEAGVMDRSYYELNIDFDQYKVFEGIDGTKRK